MFKTAYERGAHEAMAKFALALPTPTPHARELAALGLLQAPVVYDLYKDFKEDKPTSDKLMHGAELAGLGLMSANTLSAMRGPH